ncbi:MAG: 30S ribosomal protein S5 [Candidatus Babeliales bacterium]
MAQAKVKKELMPTEEYVETVLNVRRVAKVIKGGRRFAFSALVVVGDRNGKVGFALGKSREVSAAIAKALKKAKKNMFQVPMYKTTIPFTIKAKHGSSHVLLRSACLGTGVIAGGAVRAIMDAAGVKDILAKSLGSSNPQNVVKATVKALKKMKTAAQLSKMRGKSLSEIVGRDVTNKLNNNEEVQNVAA